MQLFVACAGHAFAMARSLTQEVHRRDMEQSKLTYP